MSEITEPTPELTAMAQAMSDAELIEAYGRFEHSDTIIPMQEAIILEMDKRQLAN